MNVGGQVIKMLKKIVFYCAPLFTLLFLLTAIPPEASADEGNSCVACHSKPEIDNITGRNFQDWKGSVHDENGVLCESCHHGNPDSATKTEAHKVDSMMSV